MSLYKATIRPFLFLFPPEVSHAITITILKTICKIPFVPLILKAIHLVKNPVLERTIAGLKFPNPVGLAAGFDKNALFFREMGYLGFGFVEVGTVTPLPQPGNDKPRLFRLPKDKALINRMGFNNDGMMVVAERLKKKSNDIVLGGNIGKNKITPNDSANSDYEKCFDRLFENVDYFVVNVSSPNTPGLRSLQDKEPLAKLLLSLQAKNNARPKRKPIFLKIAPDLTNEQLDDIITIAKDCKIDAVVATNTTLSREGLKTKDVDKIGAGGLSGKPLTKRSTEVVKYLHDKSNGAFPIVASGGIHSVTDAMEKLDAGATLIELYTGFIYEGPLLAKKINKEIIKKKQRMICFPNAKINIGLRILDKRPDGYHDIESIFYPVGWCDALEAVKAEGEGKMKLHLSGISLPGRRITDNLCVRLYKLLSKQYKLPSLDTWLHKTIPIGAGLGGGSSDAAHFIKLLNEFCGLNITTQEMKSYVAQLGSDCVFFIENKPVLASGRGDITEVLNLDLGNHFISIIYPEILISTPFAYSLITESSKSKLLKEFADVKKISEWKNNVVNDFEAPIIEKYPAIGEIKDALYKEGAVYAAMTGSGSAVYGIFEKQVDLQKQFPKYKMWSGDLKIPK